MFPLALSHTVIVNFALWVLIALSILALTITACKAWQYACFVSNNRLFLKKFWDSSNFSEARESSQRNIGATARIAKTGFTLIDAFNSRTEKKSLQDLGGPEELLERALRQEITHEVRSMETGLFLLAIIGITSPFIGFLGTVLGVERALEDISKSGTQNFGVVIGPIGETLVATAVGIMVTIPVVLAYYFFFRLTKANQKLLEEFVSDFIRLTRENGFKSVPIPCSSQQELIPGEAVTSAKHSYSQILKSSALIGGSTVINIMIGIVRTKVMAVLLGPAGFGLMGLYGSITDLTQSIAGMGINSSGVRQIAEAVGSGDTERIARTVVVLRKVSFVLGILGATLLIVFSRQASALTFGNDQHANEVALLAVVVLFRCVSDGQGALIQGMRRISDMAKMGVLGGLFGTIITLPVVYFLREQGIVPALIGIAATGIITSWWYSRKVHTQTTEMTLSQVGNEAASLLKLGFAFMATGLMMTGATYAIRVLVLRKAGYEAAGLYQSAWTLGGLYVGIILQSLGADFYPRLTAIAKDNASCNRLVNEQAHISLLLGGPGVIATLSVAPLVIALFYSPKFYEAVEVLRWLCLGMTLRIISWPLGYIIVAKGAQNLFFWSELAWTLVYVGLAWVCVNAFGLNGAGIAFFGSYIFHCFMIYVLVRWLSGFRWTATARQTGVLFLGSITLVFYGFYLLPPVWSACVGLLASLLSGVYAIRSITNLVAIDRIPSPIRRALFFFRLVAPNPAERM